MGGSGGVREAGVCAGFGQSAKVEPPRDECGAVNVRGLIRLSEDSYRIPERVNIYQLMEWLRVIPPGAKTVIAEKLDPARRPSVIHLVRRGNGQLLNGWQVNRIEKPEGSVCANRSALAGSDGKV